MDRLQIAFFGATNSGKSTLVNALAGQEVSLVSELPGTTTDPVRKAIELPGLGPCILVDTAGYGDPGALGAERLIMMTDIAGILRDKDDPSTLIPEITLSQAKELYASGVISGGMIPKVDCCVTALHAGVKNVVIMDGRVPHSILMELLTNEGAGTWIRRDEA